MGTKRLRGALGRMGSPLRDMADRFDGLREQLLGSEPGTQRASAEDTPVSSERGPSRHSRREPADTPKQRGTTVGWNPPAPPSAPTRPVTEHRVTDDIEGLLAILPARIVNRLRTIGRLDELLEVVMDLGRVAEARLPEGGVDLGSDQVTREDLQWVTERVGLFTEDNRAGIERTLHRISAMRNRQGAVVGLTCRVGRAVYGTVEAIRDLVESGESILILGRPGVGKTTILREMARVLADDLKKRVVVIDTSNEIAGDGDVPHPGIGRARRMQVARPAAQHAVMVEAVENHMPEVIVIDEIGTEQEAAAARTIAERGVQLVGTAHGTTLENLLMNPTLSDLLGGIQTVTLSDEEARRRNTQKSILERKAPPTFDIAIELQDRDRFLIHRDVGDTVDAMLRHRPANPEQRLVGEHGNVEVSQVTVTRATSPEEHRDGASGRGQRMRIYPYSVSRAHVERVVRELGLPLQVTRTMDDADAVMVLKAYMKSAGRVLRDAQARSLPTVIVKANTIMQIQRAVQELARQGGAVEDPAGLEAIAEVDDAIAQAEVSGEAVDLPPRGSAIRRMQHERVAHANLTSSSRGKEPFRRVVVFPPDRG